MASYPTHCLYNGSVPCQTSFSHIQRSKEWTKLDTQTHQCTGDHSFAFPQDSNPSSTMPIGPYPTVPTTQVNAIFATHKVYCITQDFLCGQLRQAFILWLHCAMTHKMILCDSTSLYASKMPSSFLIKTLRVHLLNSEEFAEPSLGCLYEEEEGNTEETSPQSPPRKQIYATLLSMRL
jgi:hypothetical protein